MTKYNTISRYLFVFMAIMLLAASMIFGAEANLKLHAEAEITDLTGTTWEFNDVITFPGEYTWSISGSYWFSDGEPGDFTSLMFILVNPDPFFFWIMETDYDMVWSTGWAGSIPLTIAITGGTDATNGTLISWLQSNATQIVDTEPTPSTGVVASVVEPMVAVLMLSSLVAVVLKKKDVLGKI